MGENINLPQQQSLLLTDHPENKSNIIPILLLRKRIKKKSNSCREKENLERQKKVLC
jgi:hypothetical protein